MTQLLSKTELADRLEKLRLAGQRLAEAVRRANDLPASLDRGQLIKLAKVTAEVSESGDDEVRDNLHSIYGLCRRPEIQDEDFSFSVLEIDRRVNDVRDAILEAENSARVAGLTITDENILLPRPIEVDSDEVRGEMVDVKSRVASIESEIATVKIRGNQIGLINIGKIEIKVDIAKAIIALVRKIDAAALARTFSGILLSPRINSRRSLILLIMQ